MDAIDVLDRPCCPTRIDTVTKVSAGVVTTTIASKVALKGALPIVPQMAVMLFMVGVIWLVWAALLGGILSTMISNPYDSMVFGAVLAIPAALGTFAWFNREKHAGGDGQSGSA